MFASETKKELKFGEAFIVVRKLSGYQLDLAREEAQARSIGHLRKLGGELITAMNSAQMERAAAQLADEREEDKRANGRYAGFDRMTVLKQGIVTWSAGEITDERLRDLDEETAQSTFEAIVDLTIPTDAEAEAKQEKD